MGLVKPPLARVVWRMTVITLMAWLPLLALTALGGRLTSGVKVPFFFDIDVHARLLIALPLLVGAEVAVHRRMRVLILQFVERQIITPVALPKFEGCVQAAIRLRDSAFMELVLLTLVVLGGRVWWTGVLAIPADTWYAAATPNGTTLTPAGYWYEFVSVPVVQFIALRWYYRLFIWGRLLWQVSRLNLRLVPSHPDSCCGLGFLGQISYTVGPFLMAHSVLLAGFIATRILNEGARLPDYTIEIVAVALFLSLLALGPLCVFIPRLLEERHRGQSTPVLWPASMSSGSKRSGWRASGPLTSPWWGAPIFSRSPTWRIASPWFSTSGRSPSAEKHHGLGGVHRVAALAIESHHVLVPGNGDPAPECAVVTSCKSTTETNNT